MRARYRLTDGRGAYLHFAHRTGWSVVRHPDLATTWPRARDAREAVRVAGGPEGFKPRRAS